MKKRSWGTVTLLNTIHDNYAYIPIRPSYILRLHRDLLKRAGLSYAGHFKSVQNYINETRPAGTVVTRFTPLAPYETPEAVEAICLAYTQAAAREAVDPLILIPVFLCDFLCIHPSPSLREKALAFHRAELYNFQAFVSRRTENEALCCEETAADLGHREVKL